MNQNDMDRYFWRAGQRRSGDGRPGDLLGAQNLTARSLFFVCLAFVVTHVGLVLMR